MSDEQQKKYRNDKPVVIYIMILFIAAFLLMALSFLMHQRSNTEVLGQLQNSMTAMQQVQATQEENIALQEQLSDLQEELDKTTAAYDGQLTALTGDLDQKQLELDAMTNLYLLQQAYSAGEYEICLQIVQHMEEHSLLSALPLADAGEESPDELITPTMLTTPADRFYQLKDATLARLDQSEPTPAE